MKTAVYLLAVLLLILPISSFSQQRMQGKWKISKAIIARAPDGKLLIIDCDDLRKSKKKMKDRQDGYKKVGGFLLNKESYKRLLASYKKARIILSDSQRFVAESYGAIIPSAIPGWNFGDTVSGVWQKEAGFLTLFVGNEQMRYSFKYKIIKATNRELNLLEILEGNNEGKEFSLIRD